MFDIATIDLSTVIGNEKHVVATIKEHRDNIYSENTADHISVDRITSLGLTQLLSEDIMDYEVKKQFAEIRKPLEKQRETMKNAIELDSRLYDGTTCAMVIADASEKLSAYNKAEKNIRSKFEHINAFNETLAKSYAPYCAWIETQSTADWNAFVQAIADTCNVPAEFAEKVCRMAPKNNKPSKEYLEVHPYAKIQPSREATYQKNMRTSILNTAVTCGAINAQFIKKTVHNAMRTH